MSLRIEFTDDDDNLLAKYIAVYNPGKSNRLGNVLYQQLAENIDGKWPWASRHTWRSWRERYKTNQDWFDYTIRRYQAKHGISVPSDAHGNGKTITKAGRKLVAPTQSTQVQVSRTSHGEERSTEERELESKRKAGTDSVGSGGKKRKVEKKKSKEAEKSQCYVEEEEEDEEEEEVKKKEQRLLPTGSRHTSAQNSSHLESKPKPRSKPRSKPSSKSSTVRKAEKNQTNKTGSKDDSRTTSNFSHEHMLNGANGKSDGAATREKDNVTHEEIPQEVPQEEIADSVIDDAQSHYEAQLEAQEDPEKQQGTSAVHDAPKRLLNQLRRILPSNAREDKPNNLMPGTNDEATTLLIDFASRVESSIRNNIILQELRLASSSQNYEDTPFASLFRSTLKFFFSQASLSTIHAFLEVQGLDPNLIHAGNLPSTLLGASTLKATIRAPYGTPIPTASRHLSTTVSPAGCDVHSFRSHNGTNNGHKPNGTKAPQVLQNSSLDEPLSKENAIEPFNRNENGSESLYPDLSKLGDEAMLGSEGSSRSKPPGAWPTVVLEGQKMSDTQINSLHVGEQTDHPPELNGQNISRVQQAAANIIGPSIELTNAQSSPSHRPPSNRGASIALNSKVVSDVHDDYFASSPSLHPTPPKYVSPPNPSRDADPASPVHVVSEIPKRTPSYIRSARRPPRIVDGPFRSAIVETNGLRKLSKKRAPDLDSETESDDKHAPRSVRPPSKSSRASKRREREHQNPPDTLMSLPLSPRAPDVHTKAPSVSAAHMSVPMNQISKAGASEPIHRDTGKTSMAPPPLPPSEEVNLPPEEEIYAMTMREWRARVHDSQASPDPSPDAPSIAGSDPFLSSEHPRRKLNGKEKASSQEINRRQTFGGFSQVSPIPEVDFIKNRRSGPLFPFLPQGSGLALPRADTQRSRHRRQSSLASTIDLSADYLSSSRRISESDRYLASNAGFQVLLRGMAENHGFTEDIAKRVWEEVGDLPMTDRVLREMRESAENTALDRLKHLASGNDRKGRDHTPSTRIDRMEERTPVAPPASTELRWSPADEGEIERRAREKYSPPAVSRAAQFVRLAGQGRGQEAIRREIRRSQGIPSSSPKKFDQTLNASHHDKTPPVAIDLHSVTTAPNDAWRAEDDALLVSGDDAALRELEQRRGRGSVKRRMAELMAQDLLF